MDDESYNKNKQGTAFPFRYTVAKQETVESIMIASPENVGKKTHRIKLACQDSQQNGRKNKRKQKRPRSHPSRSVILSILPFTERGKTQMFRG